MGYRIVVAGATGNVGREVVNILAERAFPADEVAVLASSRSQGIEIEYGDTDKMLKIQNIENFDWSGWDMAIFAIGSDATKKYAPIAAAAGCVVIDNSSLFRMDPDVPLIVPEVNPDAIDIYKRKNIIANPNCSTAQLVVALKPLHDYAKITRVVVSTYQSVSGAGKDGMDEASLGAGTLVGELKDGAISEYEIHPEDFGFAMSSNRALRVETPEQSRAMLQGVLDNQEGPARDIVVFNSAVALYAANVVDSIEAGLAPARAAIASGAAKAKLQQLIARTQQTAKV